MAFLDKLKSAFQNVTNNIKTAVQQQQQSTANQFKMFLWDKQSRENVRNQVEQLGQNRQQQSPLQQEQPQQTATQNISGAERTTQKLPTSNNNEELQRKLGTPKNAKFNEAEARKNLAQMGYDENQINTFVENQKSGKFNQELPVQKALTDEEQKESEQLVRDKRTGDLREKNTGDKLKEELTKPFENYNEKFLKPATKNAVEGIEGFVNDASGLASIPGLTLLGAGNKLLKTVGVNTDEIGRRYGDLGNILTFVGNVTGNDHIAWKGQQFKQKGEEMQQVAGAVDTVRDKTEIDTLEQMSTETMLKTQQDMGNPVSRKLSELLPSITTSGTMALISAYNPALRSFLFFWSYFCRLL